MFIRSAVQFVSLRYRPILRRTVWMTIVLGAAACSMVGYESFDATGQAGCKSTANFYFLSKTHLEISVTEKSAANVALERLEPVRVADERYSYCLNFLGSPTSNDKLTITKDKDHLLMGIVANAEDKSAEILKTVIDTGIEAAKIALRNDTDAKNAAAALRTYTDVFDPFDETAMTALNHNLKSFGMCVVVPQHGSSATLEELSRICERRFKTYKERDRYLLASGDKHVAAVSGPHTPRTASSYTPPRTYDKGILYRPRLPYPVYVLSQKNRQRTGGWYVRDKTMIAMENKSPVLTVGVNRTFFANRSTTLTFDHGVLQDVTVDKSSELLGIASVPLHLARAIVRLPAELIQLRIEVGNKEVEYLNARANLITAQAELLKAVKTRNDAADALTQGGGVVPAGLGFSDSIDVNSCQRDCAGLGENINTCRSVCRCQLLCGGRTDGPQCTADCSVAN